MTISVAFEDSQPNTTLFCYDWIIETSLPATVELKEGVTYAFEVIDADHPVGDPLMYFNLHVYPEGPKCLNVNWYPEKCGSTTPPGVVANTAANTVNIYSGVTMKLVTPILSLVTLESDFADIAWNPVAIIPTCKADPMDAMLYSIWFDGIKQADREDTHVDYDDLIPGSTHTIEVQAVPRVYWNCEASDKAAITFTTPAQRTGTLTVITDPPEATVEIDGEEKGYTPIDIPIAFDPDEYRKRVLVKVSYEVPEAFQDRSRRVTIRPGLTTRYLARLRAIARIKGTTEKDNTAKEVTFTMWAENRNRERIRHAQLYILNMTNMFRGGSIPSSGVLTVPYTDPLFAAGKNRLVCYWGDTGDRILSFKTITLPGATGDAVGIDEEWHDENDDIDIPPNKSAIDAAYAKIT